MTKRNIFFLIAIINIIEGFLGLIFGKVFIRHWHNVTLIETLFWFLSGIVFLYLAYNLKEKPQKHSKCPICKETFNHHELENGKCPYCKDVDTVDIEEYYKEYPKERDDK
ncbi:hypothetical protein [Arcobacter sp. FWKO B]|uniref:hypothetical protein n=1 Tax=Arcobacter sp. FWKO B TaxID=2593672 RepID=UPI0018A50D94|nr:hypothetical protein [Arcobacter sp. FWKO B]QOG12852.1 hypothetical protein FWKOB_09170 [Arcobacter sp. FWKO B]